MHFYEKNWLGLIGFGLVYCVGVNEREDQSSRGKMFQSNIYHSMGIKGYIVSVQEIYGVPSLSMEFYLCLWSSIFVYGVLSLSMEFYLCLWSSIFVYGILSRQFNRQYNTKTNTIFCGCLFWQNTGICIAFWKKGYCHIDGKVYTINFCPGSEIVRPTLSIW